MAKLYPAESANGQTDVGGFVVEFPSGTRKSVAWRSGAPIPDTLAAAKQYVIQLTQTMLDERRIDDLERTNMPSLVAAVQRIIQDWNDKTRTRLYAAPIQ